MKKLKILLICSLYSTLLCCAADNVSDDGFLPIDPSEYEGELKKDIIRLYADAIETCGAVVSVDTRSSMSGAADADMACLIAGKRDVIWGDLASAKDALLERIDAFRITAKAEGIKELDGVSYRPEGERKALLFIKHNLIEQVENKYNTYLTGLLLGYDVQDIEFFFQRGGFADCFDDSIPFQYAKFSDEQKQRFQEYLQSNWPADRRRRFFDLEKKEAAHWLAEQERYTNQELHQQIDELKLRR